MDERNKNVLSDEDAAYIRQMRQVRRVISAILVGLVLLAAVLLALRSGTRFRTGSADYGADNGLPVRKCQSDLPRGRKDCGAWLTPTGCANIGSR